MRAALATLLAALAALAATSASAADAAPACAGGCEASPSMRIVAAEGGAVRLSLDGREQWLRPGESLGDWTLMALLPGQAVLEDFSRFDGRVRYVDANGVTLELPKSAEATRATGPVMLGHSAAEVEGSPTDLLARELLRGGDDPDYARVAGVFEPLRRIPTYAFVGTPDTPDKVGFEYGGRSPDVDPAVYVPAVRGIRERFEVLDGLVGGHLPVLRFVYPEAPGAWTEMLAYAPFRIENGNQRLQPVWYRIARIEGGHLAWARYIDSYQPFPPREFPPPAPFYQDLAAFAARWDSLLAPGMRIDVPDRHFADMARSALVRDLLTRVGGYPKYGAVDKDYADSQHDGFPDTFTVDMEALLDWGLVEQAGQVLENYLGRFVRDDGSLLYRGPEIGQYGRMLTEAAHYAQYGGDARLLLRWRGRIDAVARLLLGLRAQAKLRDPADAAYGMIAGWSEADACLDPEPQRYMQPYFSNSSEAARGFRDLGRAWQRIGVDTGDDALAAWGRQLQVEGAALEADLQRAIGRSILVRDGEQILPAIAGVAEPFHVAVARDPADPQYRSYRAYMELLYSGSLARGQARMVIDYRAAHHDTLLGMPTAYGYRTADVAGFLSYGHGYALVQHDFIPEALLLTYANMAHEYTRGTWTAPETRNLIGAGTAAPYATPAQLMAALMARWLLVFEDPQAEVLWLGKGIPRDWLADGRHVSVQEAPTRWGRVGYEIASSIATGHVRARVHLPAAANMQVKLRLRVPRGYRLSGVRIDGKAWNRYDAATGTIDLPGNAAQYALDARYAPTTAGS